MDRGLREMAAGVQISLTLRLAVHGPGSWRNVGQEREFVRRLQVESGAQVSMSGDNWPERSLTLNGSSDVIFRALVVIVDTLQEDICSTLPLADGTQPFVTLRLRVPASQCVSLLGEGGSRVRDICTRTGAQVQVSGDMLPGDSELCITMTGRPHCVSDCVKLICQNLLETLVGILQERGWALAYQPSPGRALHSGGGYDQVPEGSTYTGGRLYARGNRSARVFPSTGEDPYTTGDPQAGEIPFTRSCPQVGEDSHTGEDSYTRGCPFAGEDLYGRCRPFAGEGPYTRDHPFVRSRPYAGEEAPTTRCPFAGEDSYTRGGPQAGEDPYSRGQHQAGGNLHSLPDLPEQPPPQPGSSCGLSAIFPFRGPAEQPAHSRMQSWTRPSSEGASEPPAQIIHELMIPNSLIGSVIGLQGANVSEIRRKSGAWIKIFPLMEGSSLRLVRIIGTRASIVVAHFMVISSLNNKRP